MKVRFFIVVFCLPIILWAAFSRLYLDLKTVPWFVWNDVMQEVEQMQRAWKSKSLNEGDW